MTFRRLDTEELAEELVYDLVYARYLLSHLPRPQRAVEVMVRAVRPVGSLVLEDVCFPGHVCYPANAAFERYLELYQAVARAKEGGTRRSGLACWEWCLRPGWSRCASGSSCPPSATARASGWRR